MQSIKALYVEFVSAAASVTQSKCLDEFYSTRIIFWASGAHKLPDLKAASEDDAVRAVTALSEKLFVEQRDRIVENVLLKARACDCVVSRLAHSFVEHTVPQLFSGADAD